MQLDQSRFLILIYLFLDQNLVIIMYDNCQCVAVSVGVLHASNILQSILQILLQRNHIQREQLEPRGSNIICDNRSHH